MQENIKPDSGQFLIVVGSTLSILLVGILLLGAFVFATRIISNPFAPPAGPLRITPVSNYKVVAMGGMVFIDNYAFRASDGTFQYKTNTPVKSADTKIALTVVNDPNSGNIQSYVLNATRTSDNRAAWQYNAGAVGPSDLQIHDGIVYYGDGSAVLALSEGDGSLLWRFDSHNSGYNSMHIVNDVAYMFGPEEAVAIRLADGTPLWRQAGDFSSYDFTPVKEDRNNLYMVAMDKFYALDVSTGKVRWSVPYGFMYVQGFDTFNNNVYLYMTNGEGIIVLRAVDGKTPANWTNPWDAHYTNGQNLRQYSLIDNTIYVAGREQVYALRVSDGKQMWSYVVTPFNPNALNTSILGVADGVVYTQVDRDIIAFNAADGHIVWRLANKTTANSTLVGSTIYSAYGLQSDNRPFTHWLTELSGAFYTCTDTITAFALNIQQGTTRWQYRYQDTCTG
ncbi:MAG TPA: PQQ-binding-like beta-propeller repeat protein [Ktedonobacteraceae bacterium]|nr:PQQ-binding-like beta-propeller repeat protein [Ktedonobacteraceae bacterium]